MEKIKTETVERVPVWATSYIMYGDDSGLSLDDLRAVRSYLVRLRREGLRLVAPVEGAAQYFESCPRFGLACDCVDWIAHETKTARAVRLAVRRASAWRPGRYTAVNVERIWNGGRGRLSFLSALENETGPGGVLLVNSATIGRGDAAHVRALSADLGPGWSVRVVYYGYPLYYNLSFNEDLYDVPRALGEKFARACGLPLVMREGGDE